MLDHVDIHVEDPRVSVIGMYAAVLALSVIFFYRGPTYLPG